jgi:hypothetical protein
MITIMISLGVHSIPALISVYYTTTLYYCAASEASKQPQMIAGLKKRRYDM